MSTHFDARTICILLRWNEWKCIQMLFSIEASSYAAYDAGSFGTGAIECLFVGDERATLTSAFSSHIWNAKEKSHKYSLTFHACTVGQGIQLNGQLRYSFIDGMTDSDQVVWEQDKSFSEFPRTFASILQLVRDDSVSLVGRKDCIFPARFTLLSNRT